MRTLEPAVGAVEQLVGQVIKGYELRERIGAGGFGAVYKAFQSTVGREVAVKIILPGFTNHPEFIRRFETEAQLVARLEHLHIAPLYDYWRDPSGAYLVMRYLRGGSLRNALQQGPYNLEEAALLLDQVASALYVAHSHGIVHRDIKPENILLDEDGNAYLADFGIAKELGIQAANLTAEDALVGSPDYLAPEQARSEEITPKTDIYSLGVVLYEMLVGQHPFPDLSPVERLFKHINDPIPEITGLESETALEINSVVQKATAKNPSDRYEDARSMAAGFREAAGLSVTQSARRLVELLTPREQEVLKLIIEGKSNREIAEELTVELGTVKWYVNRIYKKLNVRSRVQAIVRARELDLIVDGQPGSATTGVTTALPEPENPYKGLKAFQISDERQFYGRENLTTTVIERLAEASEHARFLAIVGPSGSGKSSLVRAALIPALWRGALPGSENWFIADFVPSSHPLDELEVALLKVASEQPADFAEQLRRDRRGLHRAAQLILPDDDSELLILIDQFEELFTLVESEEVRTHLLDLIVSAVEDPRSRVRVVVTLRADFYDRPLQYPEFGQLVQQRIETVLPLSAEELDRAIAKPADGVGVKFEDGLVATIVEDVLYQPGGLPLMQYALTELFDARSDHTLTLQAYREIGGSTGALAKRADDLYQELGSGAQSAVKQMFLRLVTLGDAGEDTRRRVPRSELLAVGDDPDRVDELIDLYTASRLLSTDIDHTTRSPTVELAHEAILAEWPRLREWLEGSREDIRLQRALEQATAEWRAAEQDPSFLLRGTKLARFENWSERTSMALTATEQEFLNSSLHFAHEEQREREAQIERELLAAQTLRRRAVYLTGALIATVVLALAAIGFARSASESATRAEIAEQDALRQASIGLAALAEGELGGINKERSVLLALEAVEHYPYTPQAAAALARSLEEYRTYRTLDSSSSVSELIMVATWSPDGRRIAAASQPSPNSIVIWDAASGREQLAVDAHGALCPESRISIYALDWSPSGDRIATAAQELVTGEACGAVVLDTATGDSQLTLPHFDSPIRSLDWSPDESIILSGHEDGVIRLWNAKSGEEHSRLVGHSGVVRYVNYSPDGRRIASASEDGTVRIWNAATGVEQLLLAGHSGAVQSMDWSPNGDRIVTGGDDGVPRVWDVTTGEDLFVLPGHTESVVVVAWSNDGSRIASQSLDATVKVWDAATGGFIFEIPNATPHPGTKRGYVEFSPDGQWILVGGSRVLGVLLWDATTSVPILFGHSFGQEWGSWSPDGSLIATSGTDGSARLWDGETGEQLREFDQGSFWSDWSPEGTRLVTAEGNAAGALNVWEVDTGELLTRLSVPEDGTGPHQFLTMDWSPDGALIAAADFRPFTSQALYIWDAATWELISTIRTDDFCMLGWPRFSPDGTRIVGGCIFVESGIDTPARIWDVATGEELLRLEGEDGWTYRTVWSPNGKQLLVTYEEGVAKIWDAETGEPILSFSEHQGSAGGEWSPDGTLIASGGYTDQLIKIWDSRTGEVRFDFSVPGAPLTTAWSPDGTHLIVTGDGLNEPIIKRVWRSTEELIDHAYSCCVTRELTSEEREQFGLPPAEELNSTTDG
jgi:WD40 repeat protein/serine/threonine protein kinase